MNARIGMVMLVAVAVGSSAVAAEGDLLAALVADDIASARINLNPWGPHLGFETEIDGGDPRLQELVAVIRDAEPGGGHKCPNSGAIRFRMTDGGVIAVGLLPSHTEGVYELRLYDGESFEGVRRLDRSTLLDVLAELGVPVDDPAFSE